MNTYDICIAGERKAETTVEQFRREQGKSIDLPRQIWSPTHIFYNGATNYARSHKVSYFVESTTCERLST